LVGVFYTFGHYDLVLIIELPNDETAMEILLGTGALGNVRTTTLKAFNLEETQKIIENLK
jgi:uncharacterized protein with GYD domain